MLAYSDSNRPHVFDDPRKEAVRISGTQDRVWSADGGGETAGADAEGGVASGEASFDDAGNGDFRYNRPVAQYPVGRAEKPESRQEVSVFSLGYRAIKRPTAAAITPEEATLSEIGCSGRVWQLVFSVVDGNSLSAPRHPAALLITTYRLPPLGKPAALARQTFRLRIRRASQ